MRIANLAGRLTLIDGARAIDVAEASGGRFGPDVQPVYARLDEFRGWAATAQMPAETGYDPATLGAPAPAPQQLFAIG
jgi:hypothetical protein